MSDFYLQRPLYVQAVRYTGKNYAECRDFAGYGNVGRSRLGGQIEVGTPQGHQPAHPGDWLVRGFDGVVRPLANELFCGTYSPVVDGDDDAAA